MSGTVTPSNQSKTRKSKIFASISAALVACMLLLGASLPVYASSESSTAPAPNPVALDANLSPVTMSLGSSQTVGHLTPYQLIDDFGLVYDLTHNTSDVYDLTITPANDYITVVFKGLVTTSFTWSGISAAQLQSPFFGATNISFRITVNNLNITSTIERCSVENIEATCNYQYFGAQQLYNVTSSAFTIMDNGTMFTEYVDNEPIIRYQYLVFASYRVPCTSSNFNSVMGNIMTQTVTVSQADQSGYYSVLNGFIGDYNSLEMLNYIQSQLYEIWKYDQGIFTEVASLLTKVQNIDSKLSTLLSTIINNMAIVTSNQTMLYNLLNSYINNPGASSYASSFEEYNSQLASAEDEAFEAMESAIPEYEDEWEYLETNNAAEEISLDHTSAILFWKTVTEYILDVDNIGAAATGLILISLITFIVFLLRL